MSHFFSSSLRQHRSGPHPAFRTKRLQHQLVKCRAITLALARDIFNEHDAEAVSARVDGFWDSILRVTSDQELQVEPILNRYKFAQHFVAVCRLLQTPKSIVPRELTPPVQTWFHTFAQNLAPVEQVTTNVVIRRYTTILNELLLSYATNNPRIFFHGSFAVHLLNHDILYGDIDCCMVESFRFAVAIGLLFHLILNQRVQIESIPYVKNLIRLTDYTLRESIIDIVHIDPHCMEHFLHRGVVVPVDRVFILHPVVMFFNVFKMMPLEDRRGRLKARREKMMLTIDTLCHTAGVKDCEPPIVKCTILLDCLQVDIGDHRFFFFYEVQDDYFSGQFVTDPDQPTKRYRHYRQFSSILSEQFVLDLETGHYAVNASRNQLYRKADEVHWVCVLAIVSTIGIFDYITQSIGIYEQLFSYIRHNVPEQAEFEEMQLRHNRIRATGKHMVCTPSGKFVYLRHSEESSVYDDK